MNFPKCQAPHQQHQQTRQHQTTGRITRNAIHRNDKQEYKPQDKQPGIQPQDKQPGIQPQDKQPGIKKIHKILKGGLAIFGLESQSSIRRGVSSSRSATPA